MIVKDSAQEIIASSRRYFLRTGDRELRIWMFSLDEGGEFVTPPPSEIFLPCSVHFGDDKFGVHIVNQFRTPRPYLLSYEAFTREIQIPFRPSVFMDSNLVNYIHQYVTLDPALGPSRRKVINDFLRFVVSKGLDYNGFFYYIEGVAKDDRDLLARHAVRVSESILRLHTMDNTRFLASGEIATDPKLLEIYAKEYDAPSIPEIAPLYARSLCGSAPQLDSMSKLAYASLLKIGLIHKSGRQTIVAKYREFLSFMASKLDIALGPESVLALGYFAGQYDDFIPIQRGANPGRIFKRLRSAAWDLVLLRLPTHMLGAPIENEVEIAYIGTSDRALQRIMGALKVESVLVHRPFRNLPAISYGYADLKPIIGPRVIAEIDEMNYAWTKSRTRRWDETGERISYKDLLEVIADLEAEAARFCRGEGTGTLRPQVFDERVAGKRSLANREKLGSSVNSFAHDSTEVALCDLSVDRHSVEAGDGFTISAEDIARFSTAYAHMIFDQLPKNRQREMVQDNEHIPALKMFEAIARGFRVIPIDRDGAPGYQAVGDWYACRLHRAQWETYKLCYPPDKPA